jgi:type II secretory pathway pseudopilin PulG
VSAIDLSPNLESHEVKTIHPLTADRRRSEAGFNLIEMMIGITLLFIIALAVVPLFSRAASLNSSGRESTVVSGYGRAAHEEYSQMLFTAPLLTITSGSELVTNEVWVPETVTSTDPNDPLDPALGEWVAPGAVAGRRPHWRREVRVRQFSVNDLHDNGEFDSPLDATSDFNFVHLKEVQVEVEGVREGGPLGRSRRVILTRMKAF